MSRSVELVLTIVETATGIEPDFRGLSEHRLMAVKSGDMGAPGQCLNSHSTPAPDVATCGTPRTPREEVPLIRPSSLPKG
jgi:hypothetical protein